MIVLDTSFLIDFFKGKNMPLDIINSDVATTVITFHEIISGVKHKKAKNEEKFFRGFFVIFIIESHRVIQHWKSKNKDKYF